MLISEQLNTILRSIKNQCTTDSQMDAIDNLLHSNNIKDFIFVDKGNEDDTIKFYNNKVSTNDLVYTITNPTIVGLDHEIYQTALSVIKNHTSDFSLAKSKFNQSASIGNTKFKIINEYNAAGHYLNDYRIVHLVSIETDTPFEILHAHLTKQVSELKPVFEGELLQGTSIKPTEIKFGRFLNKVLTELKVELKPKDVETFVNFYKAHNAFNRNAFDYFKVVDGEEIIKWYHSSTYANGCGTLNNSCMRLDKCQEYFDIYTNPENNVKMLILTNEENKLLGRCLLWETDKGSYMDRIYSNDHILNLFKKWANENGYEKSHHTNSNNNNQISVKIKVNMNRDFPYLDSFKFMTFDRKDTGNVGTLLTREPNDRYILLNETNGGYQSRSNN